MHKRILIIVVLMVSAALIVGCGGDGRAEHSDTETNVLPAETTALEKMEIAFEGEYTAKQIKPKLDEALGLYGLPISEDNYSRAGSTLVDLRKRYGTREMDVLDYMIRSYVPGMIIDFPKAAGISAAFLATGDK